LFFKVVNAGLLLQLARLQVVDEEAVFEEARKFEAWLGSLTLGCRLPTGIWEEVLLQVVVVIQDLIFHRMYLLRLCLTLTPRRYNFLLSSLRKIALICWLTQPRRLAWSVQN